MVAYQSDFSSLKYYPDSTMHWHRFSNNESFRDDEALLIAYPSLKNALDELKSNKHRATTSKNNAIVQLKQQLEADKETIKFLKSYVKHLDITKVRNNIGTTEYSNRPLIKLGDNHQYRMPEGSKNKWLSVKNSNSKSFEVSKSIIPQRPTFISFGMGDFLALKNSGLQYICFGSDGSYKNNPKFDDFIKTLNKHDIRIYQDNDKDIYTKLVKPLQTHIKSINSTLKVTYLKYDDEAEEKTDLRDFNNSCESLIDFRFNLENGLSWIEKPQSYTNEYNQKVILIEGKYISDNVEKIDHSKLESGVIISRVGSGKTHALRNQRNTLIIVPTNAIVADLNGLFKGESYTSLNEEIQVNGTAITYNKFYGHYANNETFRDDVNTGRIRVVVDEAHTLLREQTVEHATIYSLPKAIYMSGTLIPDFRRDLQHYKFVYKDKMKIYTSEKAPNKDSLVFLENRKLCKKNGSYIVGKILEDELHKRNANISKHKGGHIFATSAIREGVSITKSNFKQVVVVKEGRLLNKWTLGDMIQALSRVRHEVDKFIEIDTPLNIVPYYKDTLKKLLKVWDDAKSTREVNATTGEIEKIAEYMRIQQEADTNLTIEYRMLCYISQNFSKNWIDEDLYNIEEYTEPIKEALKIETKQGKEKEQEEKEPEFVEYRGEKFYLSRRQTEKFNKWKNIHKENGTKKVMKWDKFINMKELFYRSNFAKELKKQFNSLNKKKRKQNKKKYTLDLFVNEINALATFEYRYEDKIVNQLRIKQLLARKDRLRFDPNLLEIRAVFECPIEEIYERFLAEKNQPNQNAIHT